MRDSRKFFLSLTLFLAPVILALGCLEYALRQQKNYLDIKKEKFEQVAGAVEVLILGDSHAHMGLDPARFDRKTFNLASPAQSYYYDVSLLLKYLPRMNKLKHVILPVTHFGFYYLEDQSRNAHWQYLYYKTFGIPLRNRHFDLRNYSLVAIYTPYQGLKKIVNRQEQLCETPEGHLPGSSHPSPENQKMNAQELIRHHYSFIRQGDAGLNCSFLNRAFSVLRKQGINIVMVALPVHPEYSLLKDKKVREKNYSLIRQFERSHDIHFLDLQNTGIVNTGDFADPIHLNHSGALKISRIVSNSLSALTKSL